MKRYRDHNPTADQAIKTGDRSPGIPADRARILAAEARRRGDLAGAERFEAAARRAAS